MDVNAPPVVLRVRGLTKAFGRQKVFSRVDLDVAAGEVVAVTGCNGSGKTTLLKCLAGQLRPDSGSIECLRHRLTGGGRTPPIGLVSHEVQLYPHLTVRENLLFAARMNGLARPSNVVADWLIRAGLTPWAEWPTGQLSRGMRQRIAVARTLLHAPAIVLLDEPFTGLDLAGRTWVDGLIAGVAHEGGMVCFTTHEPSDVGRLAERVLQIRDATVHEVPARRADWPLRAAG